MFCGNIGLIFEYLVFIFFENRMMLRVIMLMNWVLFVLWNWSFRLLFLNSMLINKKISNVGILNWYLVLFIIIFMNNRMEFIKRMFFVLNIIFL